MLSRADVAAMGPISPKLNVYVCVQCVAGCREIIARRAPTGPPLPTPVFPLVEDRSEAMRMLTLKVQSLLDWSTGSGRSRSELARTPSHRQHLLDDVLGLNPGATTEFLFSFTDRALQQYAAHLRTCQDRRGPDTSWIREPGSPAVIRVEAE